MSELQGKTLGQWSVLEAGAGRLVLKRSGDGQLRKAGAGVLVALGCLAGSTGLFVATPDGLTLATWPVAVLLLGVAGLAIAQAWRNVAQRAGVTLSFSRDEVAGQLVPTGLSYSTKVVTAPVGQVKAVRLRHVPHPPLTLAMLEVTLTDGRALQGPEVAFDSTDPLEPVARAAASVTGRPFERQ